MGVDLGGSKLLAVGVDAEGAVLFRHRCATGRGLGPDAAEAIIADTVARAAEAMGAVGAVGVGFPGLVSTGGLVRSSVMLDGWRDVDLTHRLEARLGVACAVDTDVYMAALCEQERRGARDMLFVAVGTGIGGALILDGRLHRGAGGLAGEIGHVCIDRAGPVCDCGRRGCVNRYASGTAIDRMASEGVPARAGDPAHGELAAAALAGAGALGIAVGSALNLLDVPLVVLGGGVAELGPRYIEAVAERARRECFREIGEACRFEPSVAGYEAGAVGAAAVARQRLAGQPHSPASRSSAVV